MFAPVFHLKIEIDLSKKPFLDFSRLVLPSSEGPQSYRSTSPNGPVCKRKQVDNDGGLAGGVPLKKHGSENMTGDGQHTANAA